MVQDLCMYMQHLVIEFDIPCALSKDITKTIVEAMEPSDLSHQGYRCINHVKPLTWAKVLEHHPNLSRFTFVWLHNCSL
jgi:hypothetical protein